MQDIKREDIPKHYAKALSLQQSDPKAAFNIYKAILKVQPNIAEAYFQIGRIHMSRHAYKSALDALKKAAEIKPSEPAIWSDLVNAAVLLGSQSEQKLVNKVLGSAPLQPKTKSQLRKQLKGAKKSKSLKVSAAEKSLLDKAIAGLKSAAFSKAAEIAQTGITTYPNNAAFNLVFAAAQSKLGTTDQAEAHYKAALAKQPEYLQAHAQYGEFLVKQNRHYEGLEQLNAALQLSPDLLSAKTMKAAALSEIGQHTEAIELITHASEQDPNNPEIAFLAGVVFENKGDHETAVGYFERAEKIGKPNEIVYLHQCICYTETRDFEAAKTAIEEALRINPNLAAAEFRYGLLEQQIGNFDAAEGHVRKAIELDPTHGNYYRILTSSTKLPSDDPLVSQMQSLFDDKSVNEISRSHIGFALAKVKEDAKEFDQVFTYLKPANDLAWKADPYDIDERIAFVKELISDFEGFDIAAKAKDGLLDPAPIFVTGMPRSGTTLVEQIIASHSSVKGAGEAGSAAEPGLKLISRMRQSQTAMNDVSADDLQAFGQTVSDTLSHLMPDAAHVTDKAIQSYTVLPLLKAALPNSRVVVVRRDPRDNLFSIYKNHFVAGTHTYAYNLPVLGQYYKLFDEMIEVWRERFPDSFYEIHYENLIENQEEEARKLITAVGLEWEDQCLSFYENKRDVKTLSVYQVRQPIYKSSVKGWQRYEKELQPLFKALK